MTETELRARAEQLARLLIKLWTQPGTWWDQQVDAILAAFEDVTREQQRDLNAQVEESRRLLTDRDAFWKRVETLSAELDAERRAREAAEQAAEMLWVVLANVSGGDWTKQSEEWRDAAARWRDNYFAVLAALRQPGASTP